MPKRFMPSVTAKVHVSPMVKISVLSVPVQVILSFITSLQPMQLFYSARQPEHE